MPTIALISLLAFAVTVGCSSSDQAAIDQAVSATFSAQEAIDRAVRETVEAATPVPTATPTPVPTATPTPVPTATPTPVPTATPTLAPTVAVPDNYTKFTDESESFSIHYPNHWYTELSQIEDWEEWTEQFVTSKNSDLNFDGDSRMLLVAGLEVAGESDEFGKLDPNLNVILEPVSPIVTVEERGEASIAAVRELFDSFQMHSQQPVTLGGVSAYLVDISVGMSELGLLVESSTGMSELGLDGTDRYRSLQLSIKKPAEAIMWTVTCGFITPNPEPGAFETCNTVVRSVQLLQKD